MQVKHGNAIAYILIETDEGRAKRVGNLHFNLDELNDLEPLKQALKTIESISDYTSKDYVITSTAKIEQ